jgi:septal ring factor EnvC (AmiA/AmiB activator)
MVKAKKNIVLSILVAALNISFAQEAQISNRKAELTKIKYEILQLEKELQSKTKKERESFSTLENLSRLNFLVIKVINKLKSEEEASEAQIVKHKKEIASLEKEISELKENYEKYIVSIYKYGKTSELESLLNSGSLDQALRRYKYLQRFSERRKKDMDDFNAAIVKLAESKAALEAEVKKKEELIALKGDEERQLNLKLAERKQVLEALKKDRASLKKEIDVKKQAEADIKKIIEKLVADAERRKKEEAERLARLEAEKKRTLLKTDEVNKEVRSTEVPAETYNLDLSKLASFSALKGRLNWPILNGRIVRKFGENRHAQLKTVTINYGVDIKAANDLNVKTVADGVVSAIDWIPGYGSVIIITHRDDFRTVYSHLAEIFIKEGDRVKMGKVIAKVGESIEGNILHFEIWNSRVNQNPEIWLAKK